MDASCSTYSGMVVVYTQNKAVVLLFHCVSWGRPYLFQIMCSRMRLCLLQATTSSRRLQKGLDGTSTQRQFASKLSILFVPDPLSTRERPTSAANDVECPSPRVAQAQLSLVARKMFHNTLTVSINNNMDASDETPMDISSNSKINCCEEPRGCNRAWLPPPLFSSPEATSAILEQIAAARSAGLPWLPPTSLDPSLTSGEFDPDTLFRFAHDADEGIRMCRYPSPAAMLGSSTAAHKHLLPAATCSPGCTC
jgi:hypothetical protein